MKHYTQSTQSFAHSEAMFDYVWRGLQAARLLPRDSGIASNDYKYWRDQLSDLNDTYLKAGLKHSGTFQGYFTWGSFRRLCMEGYRTEVQQNRFRQMSSNARLSNLESLGKGQRWNVLVEVTRAMLREEGNGPITQASRRKTIPGDVLRKNSAEQIIHFCQKLYGD